MTKVTDPNTLAIRRIERRVDALETLLGVSVKGHVVLLDLIDLLAAEHGFKQQLQAALEQLRSRYGHAKNVAIVNNQPDEALFMQAHVDVVDVFLARLNTADDGLK